MKTLRTFTAAALFASTCMGATAAPLSLNQFDGTESLIDFNGLAPSNGSGPVTYAGVTFTAQSNLWMLQPYAGTLLGTSGGTFNTDNVAGNADLTLTFGTSISRFGINFGTCTGCATLAAVVTAYDANDAVVESLSLPAFSNSFVGFDFSALVSKIVIDRTDGSDMFTFIDDVRFASRDIAEEVPEPGSFALLGIAALAGALARRRKN